MVPCPGRDDGPATLKVDSYVLAPSSVFGAERETLDPCADLAMWYEPDVEIVVMGLLDGPAGENASSNVLPVLTAGENDEL